MNFNPWQDYLNLREVFCKDWNDRSFPQIKPYHNFQQQKAFNEDNIYFLNLKKELLKAVNNLSRTEWKKVIKQVPKINESKDINKKQATKYEVSKKEKNQDVSSFPEIVSYDLIQQQNSIEDKISLLSAKQKLLVAIDIKSTQQKQEKNEQILKTKVSVQKLKDSLKQREFIKNVESSKEENNENTALSCTFCRKNGEQRTFYMSHSLKKNGLVTCPILQRYTCPKCHATGPNAHTLLYCPQNNEYHSTSLTHMTPRMSSGRKRHNFKL